MYARGQHILFVDADGATSFGDLEKLEQELKEIESKDAAGHGIAVGSRAHLVKTDAVVQVSLSRHDEEDHTLTPSALCHSDRLFATCSCTASTSCCSRSVGCQISATLNVVSSCLLVLPRLSSSP